MSGHSVVGMVYLHVCITVQLNLSITTNAYHQHHQQNRRHL